MTQFSSAGNAEARPSILDVIKVLNQPELKILQWPPSELSTYSEEATTIGTPLVEGEKLYIEMYRKSQNNYKNQVYM